MKIMIMEEFFKDRITSNNIEELQDNEIFVFGSNLSGRHGKGAAKTALRWGATYGKAFGLQGRTYAIPTVSAFITNKLSLDKIQKFVYTFIEEAEKNPDKIYLVTEIGCGLAGWGVKDVAPLFEHAIAVENIHLPLKFWKVLQHKEI